MKPKEVVDTFIEYLTSILKYQSSLSINISNISLLEIPAATKIVQGDDWLNNIEPDESYGLITIDHPFGMGYEKNNVYNSTTIFPRNWGVLSKALKLLKPDGVCIATLEPSGFSTPKGQKFIDILRNEGFYLNGIFNCPKNYIPTSSIRPIIVIFSRIDKANLFVAELDDKTNLKTVAYNFINSIHTESLIKGMSLNDSQFNGFNSLKAQLQLERLESQYKDYKSYTLGDIATEINTVKYGNSLVHKPNAIYISVIGQPKVTDDLSTVTIKHHNIIQLVLPKLIKSQYVSIFFQSELGILILRSLLNGNVIPRINKRSLNQAKIAVPNIIEQNQIVKTHNQLETLTKAISNIQQELALNPKNAPSICGQIDNMLETINKLTDADKVMNLSREGESATVEFKETFSLDVKKGRKEKYIELAALKTIIAFLNSNGGILLIGVTDAGAITGISNEVNNLYLNNDKFLLHFKNQLKNRIGEQNYPFINQRLVKLENEHVLIVECQPAPIPCYLDGNEFYVRTNPATDKLEGQKLVEYVQNHFKK